jgi:hypothetical protein
MQGADIHTVAQLLGYKDLIIRMAQRYQHLGPGFLAEAVGRLDQAFGPLHQAEIDQRELTKSQSPKDDGWTVSFQVAKPGKPV